MFLLFSTWIVVISELSSFFLSFALPFSLYPFSKTRRESMNLHELRLSALWTDYVSFIGYETASHQRCFTTCTNKAVIVPVAILKRNESRSTNSLKYNDLCRYNMFSNNFFKHLPVIGFVHDVHLLAKSSPKQSAQYGWSSRLVKRWPANEVEQWVHVKHSRCHGSFLYVTPPEVII